MLFHFIYFNKIYGVIDFNALLLAFCMNLSYRHISSPNAVNWLHSSFRGGGAVCVWCDSVIVHRMDWRLLPGWGAAYKHWEMESCFSFHLADKVTLGNATSFSVGEVVGEENSSGWVNFWGLARGRRKQLIKDTALFAEVTN